MTRTTHTFDIREPQYLDQLKPHTGETKDTPSQHVRVCPLCDGKLTISVKTGSFTCQTSHCDTKEITKVLTRSNDKEVVFRGTPSAPQIPTKDLDIGCVFSMPHFGGIVTLSDATKTRYDYGNGKCMYRLAKSSGEKTFWYAHTNADGEERKGKGDEQWQPYLFSWLLEEFAGDTVFLVEGQKCQEAMIKAGFYALNAKEFLKDDFGRETARNRMFDKGVRSVVVIADDDKAGYGYAQTCATYMEQHKMPAVIINLSADAKEPGKGYDIADYIGENPDITYDAMKKKLEELFAAEVKRRQEKPVEVITEKKAETKDYGETRRRVEEIIGHRLAFNQRTLKPELDGKEIDAVTLRDFVYVQCGGLVSNEDATTFVETFARVNSYHPIRQYFISAVNKTLNLHLDVSQLSVNKNDIFNVIKSVNKDDLEKTLDMAASAAKRYLGLEDTFSNTLVFKWLIGTVARVFTPGCKMQTALVIQGAQGVGKTTFFQQLASDDWFTQYKTEAQEKDMLMDMHGSLIVELAELDGITSKKECASFKNFISVDKDTFREPYGRKTKSYKRGFVFCGTVNTDDFLRDTTGNRRFWVISLLKGFIENGWLEKERDEVWAGAVLAWAMGEQWWLTREEEAQLFESNKQWMQECPHHENLSDYLATYAKSDGAQRVVNFAHLKSWFKTEHDEKLSPRDEHSISADLENRGYKKERKNLGDGRKRYFVKSEPSLFDNNAVTEVDTGTSKTSLVSTLMSTLENQTQQVSQQQVDTGTSTFQNLYGEETEKKNIDITVSVPVSVEKNDVFDVPVSTDAEIPAQQDILVRLDAVHLDVPSMSTLMDRDESEPQSGYKPKVGDVVIVNPGVREKLDWQSCIIVRIKGKRFSLSHNGVEIKDQLFTMADVQVPMTTDS